MPAGSWYRKFLRVVRALVIFVVIFALTFFALSEIDNVFRIKTVKVLGASKRTVFGIADYSNKNILFLKNSDIVSAIKTKNPDVDTISVAKKYPSTLIIKISFSKKLAELRVADGYFSLSKSGKIISKEKNSNRLLPQISYYQNLNYDEYEPGEIVDLNDIKSSLFFIDFLQSIGLKVDSLDIKDVDMLVCNIGTQKIIFTSQKDLDTQAYQIKELIKTFKIEGKQFRSIDLRYDKIIVQF